MGGSGRIEGVEREGWGIDRGGRERRVGDSERIEEVEREGWGIVGG